MTLTLFVLVAAATPAVPQAPLKSYFTQADVGILTRDGREGSVRFDLTVGANGRVIGCAITRSSGHAVLDSATCGILVRRARFTPAKDATGAPVASGLSGQIDWKAH